MTEHITTYRYREDFHAEGYEEYFRVIPSKKAKFTGKWKIVDGEELFIEVEETGWFTTTRNWFHENDFRTKTVEVSGCTGGTP